MKQIENFIDVLKITGETKAPDFSFLPEADSKYHTADWQWSRIVAAYNKLRDPEYKADWTNHKHDKYYPWVNIVKDESKPSGFGLSNTIYTYTLTIAYVGSRHSFADPNDVLDALKKFDQIFIETRMR